MAKVSVNTLLKKKQSNEKIAAITAYDASFAAIFDQANIDIILIGDSLGMVLQGNDSTLAVTIDNIAYHTQCVRAGTQSALVIADLPFMSYTTPEQTYLSAARCMQSGANMVKLEGGNWLLPSIHGLVERGIPVCGHLGLTPQSVNVFGGYKVQGRSNEQADNMLKQALALQEAGIQLLVLECIPVSLAQTISTELAIPVIGIGAGPQVDGQILVMHDVLGITLGHSPKFSKNYLLENDGVINAIKQYITEVKAEVFPSTEHCFFD